MSLYCTHPEHLATNSTCAPAATLFGKPVTPCSDPEPHPWHGDGATYCEGVDDPSDDGECHLDMPDTWQATGGDQA